MRMRWELQLFCFLFFFLCLNWPIISVTADRWSGYSFFVIIFALWGLMILSLVFIGRGSGPLAGDDPQQE